MLGGAAAVNSAASNVVEQLSFTSQDQPFITDFIMASTGFPAVLWPVARLIGLRQDRPSVPDRTVTSATKDYASDLVIEPKAPGAGVVILTNNIERMRINSNGDIGLGIVNPDSPLDVQINAQDETIARFGRDNFGDFQSLIEFRSAKSLISSGSEIGRGAVRLIDTVSSPNRVMELGYYEFGGGLFTENLFEFWTNGVSIASLKMEPFLAVRDINDRNDLRLRHDGTQGIIETTGHDRAGIQIGGNGNNGQITLATRFGAVMVLTDEGNIGIGSTTNFGKGSGVIGIADAGTAPIRNPIESGILYVEGGALKYRGPLGTVTTIASP